MPSGRRRGTSGDIDSSLVPRPSTAEPSLSKKSVHFSEKLGRPSSSSSATDPRKSSLTRKGEGDGLSTSSQSIEHDDFGLKKPPRLEERDPALEDSVSGVGNQTLPESLTLDERYMYYMYMQWLLNCTYIVQSFKIVHCLASKVYKHCQAIVKPMEGCWYQSVL